jgi:hypothetical protein
LTYVFSSPERRPSLDWKAAYWLVPYVGGLTLISWIGAKDFGGLGALPFGWDAVVVAVFSIAIYILALYLRLPDARARKYLTELSAQAEAEEEVLEPSIASA